MLATVKTYQDGYAIVKNDVPNGLFFCQKDRKNLVTKSGKIASFKTIELAEKFMAEKGIVPAEPKSRLWTPPVAAVIAPLAEQLAALPEDTPRFVVVEATYGSYKEQGYAVVDRQNNNKFEMPTKVHGEPHRPTWNSVYQKREDAEADCYTLNTDPSRYLSVAYTDFFANALVRGNAADMGSEIPAEAEVPADQSKHQPFKPAPAKSVTFDGQYASGEIIIDSCNNAKYRAIESFFIDERTADFAADDGVYITPGWHTKAELVND